MLNCLLKTLSPIFAESSKSRMKRLELLYLNSETLGQMSFQQKSSLLWILESRRSILHGLSLQFRFKNNNNNNRKSLHLLFHSKRKRRRIATPTNRNRREYCQQPIKRRCCSTTTKGSERNKNSSSNNNNCTLEDQ